MSAAALDKEAIKQKYSAERAKRLRADGADQYVRLESKFETMAADPYTPFQEREPAKDHVTYAFIGAGFAGLVVGARMKEAGIKDVRLVEKGGNVGGTWYWNRYPGAACDTAAMIYLPLLEETGYMPSQKYVRGPEIREHCERIANHYGLYEKSLFHTQVRGMEWVEDQKVWRITTDRGDDFTAKYVGVGPGVLHVAKLPNIDGIDSFKGKSFHTSRWDYDYTGGNADGAPLDKLADKRVAIIGTGATGVQCIPQVAKYAKELFVVQRTPSSVDERNNQDLDPEWFKSIAQPGWQQKWLDNFVENQSRNIPEEDLVNDGWTEIPRRVLNRVLTMPPEDMLKPESLMKAFEETDIEKMDEIRNRVEKIVEDEETAQKLKAWYSQLCKRPCFNDDYLQAYNEPSTTLVDTDGKGVERITEKGVVVNGTEYEVDCIIYASGFEIGTGYEMKSGYDIKGRDGQLLSDYWADGMRSLHGLHVKGFPNLFMVQPNQAANMISNYPHNIMDHAKTVAQVVSHAEAGGYVEIEPTAEAESAWVELILNEKGSGGQSGVLGGVECTPGYYNNEGKGWTKAMRQSQGHPGGPAGYFAHIKQWRDAEKFEGLSFAK
ncbi:MAG: NAD(P)/FAD-dependent oxidoreductase [Alphaproteobacteria bacterium]